MESSNLLTVRPQAGSTALRHREHSVKAQGLPILSQAVHMDPWLLHLGQNPATILWLVSVQVWENQCKGNYVLIKPTSLVRGMEI